MTDTTTTVAPAASANTLLEEKDADEVKIEVKDDLEKRVVAALNDDPDLSAREIANRTGGNFHKVKKIAAA